MCRGSTPTTMGNGWKVKTRSAGHTYTGRGQVKWKRPTRLCVHVGQNATELGEQFSAGLYQFCSASFSKKCFKTHTHTALVADGSAR